MGRKELFKEIDGCLDNVLGQDNYDCLFKLTKMLNKSEIIDIYPQRTTLGHARKLAIAFLNSTMLVNIKSLEEQTMLDKCLENMEIGYIDVYDLIEKHIGITNKSTRSFLYGMLDALISAYLDRNMVDRRVIKEHYNQDLKNKQENMSEIYLINFIKKEYQDFCEEKAISLVHREGMPPTRAAYLIPRLSKLIEEDVEESTMQSFIESLSYFASIVFYNKCRENYSNCMNTFRVAYNMYENKQINNIDNLIPILIQIGFPITEMDGKIEIDFEKLNNQINIMNEIMKEKTLIIGGIL